MEELKAIIENLVKYGYDKNLMLTDKTDENTKLKEHIKAYCKDDKVKTLELLNELEKVQNKTEKTNSYNDNNSNNDDNNGLKGLQMKIAFLEKENRLLKDELKTYKEKYEKLKNFEKAQGKGRQIKQLKKTDEQIYILKFQTKLTYQEIANICDCSISTIKKRIATYKEMKGLK